MSDGLYHTDSLSWAEQQSDLLRRLARGERVNDAIDWSNVIEEIHDVGLSELNAVRNLLRQAMIHLLKLRGWPAGPTRRYPTRHWQSETIGFLADARQRFAPSMRQRIALDTLYRDALRQVVILEIDGQPPLPLPRECPFPLDGMLAEDPDIAALTGTS